jgi:hypothetical protein
MPSRSPHVAEAGVTAERIEVDDGRRRWENTQVGEAEIHTDWQARERERRADG